MTIYTAYFRTDAEFASHEIEADTPEQALRLARALWDSDSDRLDFESYDMAMPLDEIEIADEEDSELAVWQSEDLRLCLAAQDLLDALQQAVQALNEAPRFPVPGLLSDSYKIAAICDRAIAKAKGGAP